MNQKLSCRRRSAAGFTLFELIAVLVIVAIITITSMAGVDRNAFQDRATADLVEATIKWGRNAAVTSRRTVRIVAATSYLDQRICTGTIASGWCNTPCVTGPTYVCSAPTVELLSLHGQANVNWAGTATLSSSVNNGLLYFDGQGRLTNSSGVVHAGTQTVTVNGASTAITIAIDPATGYVRKL